MARSGYSGRDGKAGEVEVDPNDAEEEDAASNSLRCEVETAAKITPKMRVSKLSCSLSVNDQKAWAAASNLSDTRKVAIAMRPTGMART